MNVDVTQASVSNTIRKNGPLLQQACVLLGHLLSVLLCCATREKSEPICHVQNLYLMRRSYAIHECVRNECYDLTTMDSEDVFCVNARHLKL